MKWRVASLNLGQLAGQMVSRLVVRPAATARELLRGCRTRLAVKWVQHRFGSPKRLAEPAGPPVPRPRLLAVVTHLSPADNRPDSPARQRSIERLRQCVRSLCSTFAHTDLRIVLNTLPNRELSAALPAWARDRIEVAPQPDCPPSLLGFRVQDVFAARQEQFDWFLYTEDDLVFHDAWFLEKLATFNRATTDPRLLLLPNRFETHEGVKRYIDLRWNEKFREASWNRFASFALDGVRFGQCSNPHAATHCLSRAQLDLWLASPRRLRDQISGASTLESAATVCLMEVFELYKPHRENLHFLEVEHWDQRYSRVLAAYERGDSLALPPSELPAP